MNDIYTQEDLQQTQQLYQSIPVPEELSARLEQSIAQYQPANKKRRMPRFLKFSSLAAVCLLSFLAVCNLSPVVAQGVSDMPFLGSVGQLFPAKHDMQNDGTISFSITHPALSGRSALSQSINAQISHIVMERTTEAQQRLDEYHQAFLATGGTESEWAEHDFQINIDYQLLCRTDQYLSFVVTSVEDWSNAYESCWYYNLDLQHCTQPTLQDLLGEGYIQIANAQIQQQIADRLATDGDAAYFSPEEGGFTSINEDTPFYINKAGNPVIVFERYSIAPGFMGRQEFELTKA